MRIDNSGELRAEAAARSRRATLCRLLGTCATGTTAALLLLGCGAPLPHSSALAALHTRGVLRVLTLNSPTSYYLGAHGALGLEYRLTNTFARQLGVTLQIEPVLDAAAMRAALAQGHADLAASQISADGSWQQVGIATRPYDQVAQLVVQTQGRRRPRDITELCGTRLVVRAASPQRDLLRAIRTAGVPKLAWSEQTIEQPDPLQLLEQGSADYAVVDANEFAFARHLYPDIVVDFALPDARPLQWIVSRDDPQLAALADRFLASARQSGLLAAFERTANAESEEFDYSEAHRFQLDIATRLPQLQGLFQEAAAASGLDWRLIAAVGYQESRWQMQATSADGAEGIMMLTVDAASAIGVTDRENLRQNILGGARYLAQVIQTIPKHVSEPDRTWLALAAYNVGYGHLEDARVLAQKVGKNPDSWEDVRAQLPLLAEQNWYQQARRGYARGWEPAKFVEQVRQYLAVLEWFDTTPLSMHAAQRLIRAALVAPEPQDPRYH